MVLICFAAAMSGCETVTVRMDPVSKEMISVDAWSKLALDEQTKYSDEVKVTGLSESTIAKLDQGVAATEAVVTVVKPFIPEPFASVIFLVVGGIAAGWQKYKRSKTNTILQQVALGATITAETVNNVVKPVAETWTAFKNAQKAAATNTKAIMPDKVSGIKLN